MKKDIYGSSLYYASDKNIFDALNQHKVDSKTVTDLFRRRNTIVSTKTNRDELAKYFARLMHDYQDHQAIAKRLGVAPRRERVTYTDIEGVPDISDVKAVVDQLKKELASVGEVVTTIADNDNLSIRIQYSTIDYRVSEFAQVQIRDGTIEFIKSETGYIVRNTQNDYMNNIRDTLLAKLDSELDEPLKKFVVSLYDVPEPKLRSRFFHELATQLPGFVTIDVSAAYVFKSSPDDISHKASTTSDPDTHVERVLLRGKGVSRSELLKDLLDEENYYITKISWTVRENFGNGSHFDIEAAFVEPEHCTDFSFILSGVYDFDNSSGEVSNKRRSPNKSELTKISRAIESKSRELVLKMREEYSAYSAGGV